MTLFITGGAGFIGSNFIFYIIEKYPDYRIVCLDKLTYAGNFSTLEPIIGNPNFRFVKVDICDNVTVNNLFQEEKPDIVINFAAESHVDRSIANPELFLYTNVIGTEVLLEACRKYGVRFHQISTDEVYGDFPYDRPEISADENSPLMPSSPYSASKAAADLLVMSYYKTYKLPVTVSRSANNYGEYQHPEKLIPRMLINALNDEKLPVYGDGSNIRDWIYVGDHCAAIDKIIHRGRIGEIYNVGCNNEIKNIDMVKLLCRILNKPESLITYVDDRKGHDRRYAVDASKLQNELGWSVRTSFDNGIRKTVEWYLGNREWWEAIPKT